MNIITAEAPADIEEIRQLFREYHRFLGVDLEFQAFESELAGLPGCYGPPDGLLLLAKEGERSIGCGAIRRCGDISDRTCEMKRLYVRPNARGLGAGRRIASLLIEEAVIMGYDTMVLDTLQRLKSAMKLYESFGFRRTDPYYDNPLEGVVYWRLDLKIYPTLDTSKN